MLSSRGKADVTGQGDEASHSKSGPKAESRLSSDPQGTVRARDSPQQAGRFSVPGVGVWLS